MAVKKSPHYGVLQELTDELYASEDIVSRVDIVVLAETHDLPTDLLEIINLLPPGKFSRQRFCDQVNSSLTGHGWGLVYGTIE